MPHPARPARVPAGHDAGLRRAAARRRRGHRHADRGGGEALRPRGAGAGRGRDEARRAALRQPRGPAGRELPQDAALDVARPAGDLHQARGPPAQHPHDRVPAARAGRAHRDRDARHLRAARPPAGHGRHQARARGPEPQGARSPRVPGAGPADPGAPPGARALPRGGAGAPRGGPQGGRHQGRGQRPAQALLLDLREAPRGARLQEHLRPVRAAHHHPHARRLLSRAGRGARPLHAGAGALQGLHRHAQEQHVPVAPHHRARHRRGDGGGADPHPRDAPHRGDRDRRPLRLQAGRQGGRGAGREARRVRGADGRLAARRERRRVHGLPAHRPLPGGGVRLHPAAGAQAAPEGRDGAGLRLHDPHGGGPAHGRRARERRARAPAPRAAERRHGRDHHLAAGPAARGLAAPAQDAGRARQGAPLAAAAPARRQRGLGREMLERELKRLRRKPADVPLEEVARAFGCSDLETFYARRGRRPGLADAGDAEARAARRRGSPSAWRRGRSRRWGWGAGRRAASASRASRTSW